jgi:hypothetical protein
MFRPLLFLLAGAFATAVTANEGKARGEEMKAHREQCERQANQQNLVGKERKKFLKQCGKGWHEGKRHDDRDAKVRPAPAQASPPATVPQAAQPSPQPPAAGTATPAPPPTTPAAAPPAAQPPTQPVTTAKVTKTAPNSPERRAECESSEEFKKASIPVKKVLRDKCMKAP